VFGVKGGPEGWRHADEGAPDERKCWTAGGVVDHEPDMLDFLRAHALQ